MLGIVSYGAYIPIYRLSREAIGAMWSKAVAKGEKAVANADEDSVTMAVEALLDCLQGADRQKVDGLYFATDSPPYVEKQSASIIRAAADLRTDILTMDIAHSLRGAGSAMKAAMDSVKAGSAGQVAVVTAERRIPAPNSDFELAFGDGAGAFLIGDSDVLATIDGSYHLSSEFVDVWRKSQDHYMQSWEDRFVRDEAYLKAIPQAVSALLKKQGLSPKDITKAAFYGPDARTHAGIAKAVGFPPELWFEENLPTGLDARIEPEQGHTGIAEKMAYLTEMLGQEAASKSYTDADIARLSFGSLSEEDVRAMREGRLTDPSVEQVMALADVFGVDPSYFLSRAKSPPLLDREAMQIFRDETVSAIAHKSLHLPGREKEMILSIIRQFEDSRRGADGR